MALIALCPTTLLLPVTHSFHPFPFSFTASRPPSSPRASRTDNTPASAPSRLNISVFRFTLGIPGFDDSELPRVIGITFGALLLLNHFLTADFVTPAQLRSEAVALINAALSINLPAISKSLNGEISSKAATLMSASKQIFVLANDLLESHKEELAWASYALIKNSKTTSLAIWHGELLCARGFWEIPLEAERDVLGWLTEMLRKMMHFAKERPFYLPTKADCQGWKAIPKGVECVLIQPLGKVESSISTTNYETNKGFIILLSNIPNAYNEKDKVWVALLCQKLFDAHMKIKKLDKFC